MFAEIGLFHSIGRADFKSNVIKFINISVLSGTFEDEGAERGNKFPRRTKILVQSCILYLGKNNCRKILWKNKNIEIIIPSMENFEEKCRDVSITA